MVSSFNDILDNFDKSFITKYQLCIFASCLQCLVPSEDFFFFFTFANKWEKEVDLIHHDVFRSKDYKVIFWTCFSKKNHWWFKQSKRSKWVIIPHNGLACLLLKPHHSIPASRTLPRWFNFTKTLSLGMLNQCSSFKSTGLQMSLSFSSKSTSVVLYDLYLLGIYSWLYDCTYLTSVRKKAIKSRSVFSCTFIPV